MSSDVHPIVETKQKLVDLIADEVDSETDVLFGRDPSKTGRSRAINVHGGLCNVNQEYLAIGRASEEEVWYVTVTCASAAQSYSPQNAESSALRLVNTVSDTIADNRTLDGLVNAARVTYINLNDVLETANNMIATVDMTVELTMTIGG